jgi:hypothetical protein
MADVGVVIVVKRFTFDCIFGKKKIPVVNIYLLLFGDFNYVCPLAVF